MADEGLIEAPKMATGGVGGGVGDCICGAGAGAGSTTSLLASRLEGIEPSEAAELTAPLVELTHR